VNSSQIQRPSETAIGGDGITEILSGSYTGDVGIAFGCEGTFRHHGIGANYLFSDGHSKYFGLNLQTVVQQNSSGIWYMKYLTYDQS